MREAELIGTGAPVQVVAPPTDILAFTPDFQNDQLSGNAKPGRTRPVLSFVIPIYNDGRFGEPLCLELIRVLSVYFETAELNELIEVIFVDDGSLNDSVDQLRRLTHQHQFVKVVELSRNFGHHIAISCGFNFTSGDYVCTFDADMQDPPSELPKLLSHLRAGNCDVVQGIRPLRKDPFLHRLTSQGFIWLFNKISGIDLPQNCSAMRIMNRRYIEAFNRYTEKVRFALGLEFWLGFRRDFVEIGHAARLDGTSSYNLRKRAELALEAIISFSDVPLKLSIYTGCSFALIGVLLGIGFIVAKLALASVLPGFTSIIAVLLFSQGIVLMMLGITGLYIGRILKEVQNRPLYIVRKIFNFEVE